MTDVQHLEKQVAGVDIKVSSILTILSGNGLDKEDKGMIGTQNDHEKRLVSLEKLKDRLVWFLIGITIPASWGLIDIIQKVILKK